MNGLLSVGQARARLLSGVEPVEAEEARIAAAVGRRLAENVRAPRAQPPQALSAMDGYAVRDEDVAAAGARLTVVGEAPAGGSYDGVVGAGEAVRIFTGGPVPDGATRIVVQEAARRDGDVISIAEPQVGGEHIRRRGIDFETDELLLEAGEVLSPASCALAAAANRARVLVRRKPSIGIVASGDELVEPGGVLEDSHIINSAAYGIAALAERSGCVAALLGVLPDEEAAAALRLESALGEHSLDVIVAVGGASVGDRDVMKPVFERIGARIDFAGVAVRPGKPTWSARIDGGPVVLGLPGNPASALACGYLFLRPLVGALFGDGAAPAFRSARLAAPVAANGPRETYLRARLSTDEIGAATVIADARQDSSLLTPFAQANALLRRQPDAPAVDVGAEVDVLPLD
ncbi:MAG: gephyrin-like molybdotransferase Glp [Pseudomonadota bacterium]